MIEAIQVSKSYGSRSALKSVSLQVGSGTCFALLGPNGAGKTTFVKALLNLVDISAGTLRLDGQLVQNAFARQRVAYLPEGFNFFPYYTVSAVVAFYAKMRGLAQKELQDAVADALEKVKMAANAQCKVGTLSKGMLQRTGIACLLVGDSRLLILDEPFSGLDPIGIKELKDIFKEFKRQGKTVFINSHILSEMQQICDEAAILNNGQLLACGRIREMTGGQSLEDYFYQKIGTQQ